MSYQGSAVCSAKRVHFCQYCNTIVSYPISRNISVSGALTRESAANSMADQADEFIQSYVEDHKCSHCGQYQTSMAYKSLSRFCAFRIFAVVVVLFFFYSIVFSLLENDYSGFYSRYLLCCLPIGLDIFWNCFKIMKYYGKKPEKLPDDVYDEAREEYRFQRNVFRKLNLLLIFGFLCCFIPVFGMCISGCILLTYYVNVYILPGRFRSQGLPLYAQSVNIH